MERRKERKLGKWAGLSLRLGVERRKDRKLGKWAGLSLQRLGVERRKERNDDCCFIRAAYSHLAARDVL